MTQANTDLFRLRLSCYYCRDAKGLVLVLARCDRGGEVADGDVESDVERSYLILMVEAGIKNAE